MLTIKLQEENTGENLHNLGVGKDFLATTQKTWTRKEKNGNLEITKIFKFF